MAFTRRLHRMPPAERRATLRAYHQAKADFRQQQADARERLEGCSNAAVAAECWVEIRRYCSERLTGLIGMPDPRPIAATLCGEFEEDAHLLEQQANAESEDPGDILLVQASLDRELAEELRAISKAPSAEVARDMVDGLMDRLSSRTRRAVEEWAEAEALWRGALDEARDADRLVIVADASDVRTLDRTPRVRMARARSPHAQRRRAASSSESSGTDPGDPEPAPRSPGHVAGLLPGGRA